MRVCIHPVDGEMNMNMNMNMNLRNNHIFDLHIILCLSAVQIYDYFVYSCSFLHLRDKCELSINQLPVGLIAHLVRALHRHRRGHGFDSRSSLNFFRFLSFQLLKLTHLHCDVLHIILYKTLLDRNISDISVEGNRITYHTRRNV